ncbi:protein-tyrosine phosphatase family protein [Oerskovia merdavium]|uniref:Protein phosphatase n=1 Tax=Oerskovia merdavium TaxID=2762227 RepID=A0ABR8U1X2_9CELL|nr:protein-tyrosine phosphatase family protein [Oerskovia merdavium]MBD7982015.1 protein phosphatase [Oerskovia merdavium]
MGAWNSSTTGLVTLPDGRQVRGRGLAAGPPLDDEPPELGVYLTGAPHREAWESSWVAWPDFGLPRSTADAVTALHEAFERASTSRVEIVCDGGTGRTGTSLALLARLAGVTADEAVDWVRAHYRPGAVETPEQELFVARVDLTRAAPPGGPTP